MKPTTQAMRERRTALSGAVTYSYDPDESGRGRWINVSRVGACIRLGRYLRPGRDLRLRFPSPLEASEAPVEVQGRVSWCRQVPGAPEFTAGVRLLREDPEAALAFAALGYRPQPQTNKSKRNEVEPLVWPCFRAIEEPHSKPAAPAAIRQAV